MNNDFHNRHRDDDDLQTDTRAVFWLSVSIAGLLAVSALFAAYKVLAYYKVFF